LNGGIANLGLGVGKGLSHEPQADIRRVGQTNTGQKTQ